MTIPSCLPSPPSNSAASLRLTPCACMCMPPCSNFRFELTHDMQTDGQCSYVFLVGQAFPGFGSMLESEKPHDTSGRGKTCLPITVYYGAVCPR